jgi:hypothetical protein
MKKDNLLPVFLAVSILLQTVVPVLLGLFAVVAMVLTPSILVSPRRSGIIIHVDWLFAFLIIAISTVNSGSNSQSISYILTFVSMYILVRYSVAQTSIDTIARVLYVIMIISLLGMIGEFFIKYNANPAFLSEVSFVFSDRNELGMYLAGGYMACLYLVKKQVGYNGYVNKLLLVLIPILLILLASRSALLALFMGVLFYFNKGFKFYLVSLLVVFLAFALFAIMPASLLENLRLFNADSSVGDSDVIRLVLISAAISLFIENPIYGVGPNMFQVMSGQFLGALQTTQVLDLTDGLATHNSYLQYIVELGMFMGLLIIYEVGRLLRTYIIYRSRPAYKQQQAQLKFIFSIAVVFMVSGAFINIHSSIFFILALFGIERIIKKQIRPVVMEFRSV